MSTYRPCKTRDEQNSFCTTYLERVFVCVCLCLCVRVKVYIYTTSSSSETHATCPDEDWTCTLYCVCNTFYTEKYACIHSAGTYQVPGTYTNVYTVHGILGHFVSCMCARTTTAQLKHPRFLFIHAHGCVCLTRYDIIQVHTIFYVHVQIQQYAYKSVLHTRTHKYTHTNPYLVTAWHAV